MAFLLPILFSSVFCLILLFNCALVKYYTDPHESIRVVLLIQIVSLSLISLHSLMLPIDTEDALQKNLKQDFN